MDDFILDMAGRYIRGEMTNEEMQEFESGMQRNEELCCLVRLYKEIDIKVDEDRPSDDGKTGLNKTLKRLNTIYFRRDRR
jgi:hypothetical protein